MTASSPEKTIRLLAELPQREPHCQRYVAEQPKLRRRVEMRVLPEGADPKEASRFERELLELAKLDHPAFPSVLERGETRERPYYLVPLRDDPSLAEAIEAGTLSLADRCHLLRALANGMAELHMIRAALGPVHPELFAWEARQGRLLCWHHRHDRASPYDAAEAPRLPDDVQPGGPNTSRGDSFHWAHFGYRLLTGGQSPFPYEKGCLEPIRVHVPRLVRGLAHALEANLAEDPKARSKNAVELAALLREVQGDLLPEQAISLEASGTIPREAVAESLELLRAAGRIAEVPEGGADASGAASSDTPAAEAEGGADDEDAPTRELPFEPEPLAAGTDEPGSEPSAEGAGLSGLLEEPPLPNLAGDAPLPPAAPGPAPATPTASQAGTGPWAKKDEADPAGAKAAGAAMSGKLIAAALAGGLGLAGLAFVLRPPTTSGGNGGGGAEAEAPRRRYATPAEDPYVRLLLKTKRLFPRDFQRIWRIVDRLSQGQRLPEHLNDRARIEAIQAKHEADPEGALRDLGLLLDDLREAVPEK